MSYNQTITQNNINLQSVLNSIKNLSMSENSTIETCNINLIICNNYYGIAYSTLENDTIILKTLSSNSKGTILLENVIVNSLISIAINSTGMESAKINKGNANYNRIDIAGICRNYLVMPQSTGEVEFEIYYQSGGY